MKLRSKGLGRKELVMDFREYEVTTEDGEVLVTGTIREPVTWDFSIRIAGDDIPGMLRVGLNRHTLTMAARWVLRRPGTRTERTRRSEPTDQSDTASTPPSATVARPSRQRATVAPRPTASSALATSPAQPPPSRPPEPASTEPTATEPADAPPLRRTPRPVAPPATTSPAPPPRQRTRKTVSDDALPGVRGFPRSVQEGGPRPTEPAEG